MPAPRSRRGSALAPWILLIAAAGSAPAPGAAERPGRESRETDAAVEYFRLDIPLIGGGELKAESLRGEILVVDVWGTWCGPCRKVIPHLIEIQSEFGAHGVRVIGISAEPGENEEEATRKVLRYATEMGINYSLGIFNPELYAWIHSLMRFEGDSFTVPSTFVVDADGAVIARYPGYFHGQEEEIKHLLRERLGAPRLEGEAGAGESSPRR